MSLCGICKKVFSHKHLQDIYAKHIGDPPITIKQLLLRITLGIEHQFASNSICKKCINKLSQYYNASIVMDNVAKYIMKLMEEEEASEIPETVFKEEFDSSINERPTDFFFTESLVEVKEEEIDEIIENEANPLADIHDSKQLDEILPPTQSPHSEQIYHENNDRKAKLILKMTASKDHDDVQITNKSKKIKKLKRKLIKVDEIIEERAEDEVKKQYVDCTQSKGVLIYHSSGIGQPIGIHCQLCDRTFEHPKTFKAHKKYIGFAGYICESCGITCFSQSGFLAHTKRHSSIREFQCTQCDAAFYRKAGLTQHMARHKGETPFQCEVCAKCFVHRAALAKHKIIHDESTRRIDCEVCDKKFRTVSHLRRHMAIHTGAKPFSCPICGNRFSQAYNMKAHMKLHSETQLNKEIHSKPLQCPKCSEDFQCLLEYQNHVTYCS